MDAAEALAHQWITLEKNTPAPTALPVAVRALGRFSKASRIARVRAAAASWTLPREEHRAVAEVFLSLDSRQVGLVSGHELRRAMSSVGLGPGLWSSTDEVHWREFLACVAHARWEHEHGGASASMVAAFETSEDWQDTTQGLKRLLGEAFSLEEIESMLVEAAGAERLQVSCANSSEDKQPQVGNMPHHRRGSARGGSWSA